MTTTSKPLTTLQLTTAFSLHVTPRGCHQIIYDAVDTVIAAIPSFMPQSASEQAARTFLDAMNEFYRHGGCFPNFNHK